MRNDLPVTNKAIMPSHLSGNGISSSNQVNSIIKKCRVCLQHGEIPIFTKNNPLDFPLTHYLKLICNIDVTSDDIYPQYLCQSCSDALNIAITLRKTAMKSQLELKVFSLTQLNVKNTFIVANQRNGPDLTTLSQLPKRIKKESKKSVQIELDYDVLSPLHKDEYDNGCEENRIGNNSEAVLSPFQEKEINNEYKEKKQKEKNNNSEIPILTLEQVKKLRTKDIPYCMYYEKVCMTDKKVQYQCRICKKAYKKGSISDHLLTHLPDTVSLYVCEVCGKSFKKFCSFYKHGIIHKDILPFKCKVCPYKGRSKELLQVHIKRVHKKEYNYQCKICFKKFLDTNNLRYHLRRHSEPKFQCTVCQKLFYENGVLKKHIQSQHTDSVPHRCDVCGNLYKDRKNLLSHQIKIHKRKQVYNNRATYLKIERLENSTVTDELESK